MARIGILGGTFDPPHNGHIAIARAALKELGLDKILFIPAKIPPHKTKQHITSPEHRLNMLRLATSQINGFEVSDIEIKRSGPSFTVDTLEQLHAADPGAKLILIVGADNVTEIEGWYEPETIAGLASIAAAPRGDFPLMGKFADRIIFFSMPPTDISSSDIRNKVNAGRPINGLVPPDVADYIIKHGLYLKNE